MEFIGYAYNVKELREILSTVPDYATVVVHVTECTNSTLEVYYDESRQEVILKRG